PLAVKPIDLSTRIKTRAKDGSLLGVTGTAMLPVRYVYSVEQRIRELAGWQRFCDWSPTQSRSV
ncbi:MAG TPA: hypothetical protein VF988_02310, partial [Verrucomicrobiae bacterium]